MLRDVMAIAAGVLPGGAVIATAGRRRGGTPGAARRGGATPSPRPSPQPSPRPEATPSGRGVGGPVAGRSGATPSPRPSPRPVAQRPAAAGVGGRGPDVGPAAAEPGAAGSGGKQAKMRAIADLPSLPTLTEGGTGPAPSPPLAPAADLRRAAPGPAAAGEGPPAAAGGATPQPLASLASGGMGWAMQLLPAIQAETPPAPPPAPALPQHLQQGLRGADQRPGPPAAKKRRTNAPTTAAGAAPNDGGRVGAPSTGAPLAHALQPSPFDMPANGNKLKISVPRAPALTGVGGGGGHEPGPPATAVRAAAAPTPNPTLVDPITTAPLAGGAANVLTAGVRPLAVSGKGIPRSAVSGGSSGEARRLVGESEEERAERKRRKKLDKEARKAVRFPCSPVF